LASPPYPVCPPVGRTLQRREGRVQRQSRRSLHQGTGGTELSFYRERGLEEAIQRIGAELQSQYFVTYRPNNPDEAGFHDIAVTVSSPELKKVQTRPGYWISSK
jgi:hypothetical protein